MADAWLWIALILGLALGFLLASGENGQYAVYDDEDNLMEDLEGWILVDDLEEELEDEGYYEDEETSS